MLILHISDALKNSTPNCITQVLRGRLWVDIPEIHGSVDTLHALHTTAHSHASHSGSRCHSLLKRISSTKGCVRSKRRRDTVSLVIRVRGLGRSSGCCSCSGGGGLSHERLSSGGLSLLSSSLLRFGNIRATIFTIVDSFTCPSGFCG